MVRGEKCTKMEMLNLLSAIVNMVHILLLHNYIHASLSVLICQVANRLTSVYSCTQFSLFQLSRHYHLQTYKIMSMEPVVTVKHGTLKGSIKSDYQGKPYYSFQGIPYAKPPIGELRFKPPQPLEPWLGIKDATKEGNICYSMNILNGIVNGSEDCLFLNVYTPELPLRHKSLRPVMFWIHGGGFIVGSGNSDFQGPDYLISEDIVLVTINYRLGLLGFLSFDDVSLGITGNAGLKDQVLALKWVNENICRFGGDPNNVTIFGLSAGGASVHYLILSTVARGLYQKAILQSGTALSPWALCQSPKSAIATKLGMTNASDSEILKTLLTMTVDKILKLQQTFEDNFYASCKRVLGPVIESKEAEMPFLTDHPLDILQSGNYNHVPFMIGFTSKEGMLFDIQNKLTRPTPKFDMTIEAAIPHNLNVSKHHEMYKLLREKIKKFYFGSEEITPDHINQYYLLQGDASFVFPVYCTMKRHISTSNKPIFLYRLSADSKLNFNKGFAKFTAPGTCHGDDLGYLFKNLKSTPIIPNSTEEKGIKTVIQLWSRFARTGNPNSIDSTLNVTWRPIENSKFFYLDIGDNVTTGLNPDYDRIKFWDSVYPSNWCKCNL